MLSPGRHTKERPSVVTVRGALCRRREGEAGVRCSSGLLGIEVKREQYVAGKTFRERR
jgi:uncharacterized protein (DUF2342 family)